MWHHTTPYMSLSVTLETCLKSAWNLLKPHNATQAQKMDPSPIKTKGNTERSGEIAMRAIERDYERQRETFIPLEIAFGSFIAPLTMVLVRCFLFFARGGRASVPFLFLPFFSTLLDCSNSSEKLQNMIILTYLSIKFVLRAAKRKTDTLRNCFRVDAMLSYQMSVQIPSSAKNCAANFTSHFSANDGICSLGSLFALLIFHCK